MHRLTTLDLPSDGERRACGNLLGEQVFARFRFSAARACALVRKEARAQSTLFQHHGPLAGGHSQVSTCPIGLFERVPGLLIVQEREYGTIWGLAVKGHGALIFAAALT